MDEAVMEEETNGGGGSDKSFMEFLTNSFFNDVLEIGADFGVMVWT